MRGHLKSTPLGKRGRTVDKKGDYNQRYLSNAQK